MVVMAGESKIGFNRIYINLVAGPLAIWIELISSSDCPQVIHDLSNRTKVIARVPEIATGGLKSM